MFLNFVVLDFTSHLILPPAPATKYFVYFMYTKAPGSLKGLVLLEIRFEKNVYSADVYMICQYMNKINTFVVELIFYI